MQVRDLDPNTIQARVDETNRLNYKMTKARPQDAVAAALKAELDSFKEQLPLLQEVCCHFACCQLVSCSGLLSDLPACSLENGVSLSCRGCTLIVFSLSSPCNHLNLQKLLDFLVLELHPFAVGPLGIGHHHAVWSLVFACD